MKKSFIVLSISTAMLFSATLKDATVSLYKVKSDNSKEQVDIGIVKTDENGRYTIPNVAQTNISGNDDFYYEIKIEDGNKTLLAPLAISSDGTKEVNLTKSSTIATKVLQDVIKPNKDNLIVLEDEDIINGMTNAVESDLNSVVKKIDEINVANMKQTSKMANGLVSLMGNIEVIKTAAQFSSNYRALKTSIISSSDDFAGYLTKVIKRACRRVTINDMQNTIRNPLPRKLANLLGVKEKNKQKYTIDELINGNSSVNFGKKWIDIIPTNWNFQKSTQDIVDDYKSILRKIKVKVITGTSFSDVEEAIFLSMRTLEATTITSTTRLSMDQSVTFLYAMYEYYNKNGDTNLMGELGEANSIKPVELVFTKNLVDIISNLESNKSLSTSSYILDYTIYSDSGFGCNNKKMHFKSSILTYTDTGVILNDINITTTNSKDLINGYVTLTINGDKGEQNVDSICVTTNVDINYTIKATFNDNSSDSIVVSRQHYIVPESENTYSGSSVSKNGAYPTNTSGVVRPLFTWTDPITMKSQISNAPVDSSIYYTYELWHVSESNPSSIVSSSCQKDETHTFYNTNSFIPSVDCDTTCAGSSVTNVECRVNLQTYLLDKFNAPIGQATGGFTYFKP